MLKKVAATVVSIAVLFGTMVRTDAVVAVSKIVLKQAVSSENSVLDKNGGKICLKATGDKKTVGKVVSVSIAYQHGGAVTEDGSLYMWGSDEDGALGDGTNERWYGQPVKVLENIRSVSVGHDQNGPVSGAVAEDGNLYMWGSNYQGKLGDGTEEDRDKPVKVLENVQSVSLGGSRNAAVTEDGSLYVWGDNFYGQIVRDGKLNYYCKPIKVLDNIQSVSMGIGHIGAVTKDGDLYMWGDNRHGELGDGTEELRQEPVKVLENVRSVCLGSLHSGAVTEDGDLYMWGDNANGEVGNGTEELHCNIPVKVLGNVQSISLGDSHSGAVTEDGSLYMWGDNCYGELGNGTKENNNKPVKVMENIRTVNLGAYKSGAVSKDGNFYMWGANDSGQLADDTFTNQYKPVRIPFFSVTKFQPGQKQSENTIPPSVTKKSQKITYQSSAIKKGNKVIYRSAFSLNAKTSGTGKLTYKSSNSKILSVNAKGKVTVKGYGPAYITIRASKRGSYKAAVRRFKLTAVPGRGKVTKAEQKNGAVRFQWKPEKTADGYEYVFAYNKEFSSQSRKKTSKTGLLLKNYKTGTKRMYFKVRTYKKVGKKTYYGSWSKVCALKLKKARKTGASSYAIAN